MIQILSILQFIFIIIYTTDAMKWLLCIAIIVFMILMCIVVLHKFVLGYRNYITVPVNYNYNIINLM